MPRIILVDNYDSFTYNLYHYIEGKGGEVVVVRNDELDSLDYKEFDGIVLSPGPGLPQDAGDMMRFINENMGKVPILGVCLGMQAIALTLGGGLLNQSQVKHGVKATISIKGGALFKGFGSENEVGLYHSWAVDDTGNYRVNAISNEGIVMAIENSELKLYAVQFHPESIMTQNGNLLIANFLDLID